MHILKEDYYKKYFGVTPNQFDIIGDPNSHDTYLTVARLALEDEVEKNQDLMKGVLALNYEALLNLKVELGFHNITGEEEEDPTLSSNFINMVNNLMISWSDHILEGRSR